MSPKYVHGLTGHWQVFMGINTLAKPRFACYLIKNSCPNQQKLKRLEFKVTIIGFYKHIACNC